MIVTPTERAKLTDWLAEAIMQTAQDECGCLDEWHTFCAGYGYSALHAESIFINTRREYGAN
jgi:hypothetical protein